jgi:hypothetical protein
MRTIKQSIFLFGLSILGLNANAQWNSEEELDVTFSIPAIALLDIEPSLNNTIYFSISAAIESGASPEIENTSNETLWLNYSSALESSFGSRTIVAQISGESLPDGITLNVQASQYTGSGKGECGQSAGKVALSNQPQNIITNVRNCYTGDGEGNGHSLTFSIEVDDYSQISLADDTNFTILYTISDN